MNKSTFKYFKFAPLLTLFLLLACGSTEGGANSNEMNNTGTDTLDCQRSIAEFIQIYKVEAEHWDSKLSASSASARTQLREGGAECVAEMVDVLKSEEDLRSRGALVHLMGNMQNRDSQALLNMAKQNPPIIGMWIAGAVGEADSTAVSSIAYDHLSADDPYIRHMAALFLAYRETAHTVLSDTLIQTSLLAALTDDHDIEGSPFKVSGSAFGCWVQLGAPAPEFLVNAPVLSNEDGFSYENMTIPFPLYGDQYSMRPAAEKQAFMESVREWLSTQ